MQERLASWVGRDLSQLRVNAVSLILDFWELDDDLSVWVYAEEFQVVGSALDPVALRVRRSSGEAVVAAHALLGGKVTAAEVIDGRLRLAFAEGGGILVAPQPTEQAWALTFAPAGSITCEAGGALDVRPG